MGLVLMDQVDLEVACYPEVSLVESWRRRWIEQGMVRSEELRVLDWDLLTRQYAVVC